MSDLCRCADEVRCAMRAELERLTAELKNEIQCKNNLAEMSKSLTAENAELKRVGREQMTMVNRIVADNYSLKRLVIDAIEDETEFETEWNKAARALIENPVETG